MSEECLRGLLGRLALEHGAHQPNALEGLEKLFEAICDAVHDLGRVVLLEVFENHQQQLGTFVMHEEIIFLFVYEAHKRQWVTVDQCVPLYLFLEPLRDDTVLD